MSRVLDAAFVILVLLGLMFLEHLRRAVHAERDDGLGPLR